MPLRTIAGMGSAGNAQAIDHDLLALAFLRLLRLLLLRLLARAGVRRYLLEVVRAVRVHIAYIRVLERDVLDGDRAAEQRHGGDLYGKEVQLDRILDIVAFGIRKPQLLNPERAGIGVDADLLDVEIRACYPWHRRIGNRSGRGSQP